MTVHLVPFVPARRKAAARVRRPSAGRLAWCVLTALLVLETLVLFFPQRMLVSPAQMSTGFKQLTGYSMLALMGFAIFFGPLRKLPRLARHLVVLNEFHQFSGLLVLLLLAFHLGHGPSGFLQYTFHALALASAAGALRAAFGTRLGPSASRALLVLHISLFCVVAVAVLLHLYLVYAYTA